MRHVLSGAGLVSGILSVLVAACGAANARPARFAIDPDPNSPTLGDILDREVKANGPRPALRPVEAPPAPVTVSTPYVPRAAVTVLAPRVRSRSEPDRR